MCTSCAGGMREHQPRCPTLQLNVNHFNDMCAISPGDAMHRIVPIPRGRELPRVLSRASARGWHVKPGQGVAGRASAMYSPVRLVTSSIHPVDPPPTRQPHQSKSLLGWQ